VWLRVLCSGVLFVKEMDGNFGGQRIDRKCSDETVKTTHSNAEC